MEKTISQQHSALLQLGTELTKERKSSAEKIEKNAVAYLKQLGMPHAQFVVVFEKLTEPRFNGTDALQFLFSANKGHEPRELARVASGGEMSRLMLSLKAILASAVKLPTMIFDEIDSGISGEVAIKTANILSEMSRQHQLICITHLPQVAAKANRHFKVIKLVEKNITNTRVLMLNDDDKVREIAQMLAGEKPSEAALENAKQLMN